jgi:tRNA pseudouridine55 synthase
MSKTPGADAGGGGLHGILLIDKERGWTSHDVVAKARGITRQRKIGHTGTLDPMATGLLVLCLGDATRLVEYMAAHEKRYDGEITLGVATDTDDAEGRVTATAPVAKLSGDDLSTLAARLTGEILQRPPAYSAVSVGGKRAYAAARAGTELTLPERPVVVHELELTCVEGGRLRIELRCGPGTYVRSIARDIGAALGCGAHLSALRRTSVGGFTVSSAVTLDELAARVTAGSIAELLLAPDEGITGMGAAILGPNSAASFAHGRGLDIESAEAIDQRIRIYDTNGSFFGVGEIADSGRLKATKVLANSR